MHRKTAHILILCLLVSLFGYGQSSHPLDFFPYAAGNIWEYKDASTQEIVYTRYNDTVWVGKDSSIFIRGRRTAAPLDEKLDTAYNLFNLRFQPSYPRYKFGAGLGESWQAGVVDGDAVMVTVTNIYQGWVFGVSTTIKVFTFEIVRPPPQPRFSLGDDYFGERFGLVFSLIEGGSAPYLAGAVIDGVHWGTLVDVKEHQPLPSLFELRQNYPNPFNPSTVIKFSVGTYCYTSLHVSDMLGRQIATLVNEKLSPGQYETTWNAQGFSSGVYFYRLIAGEYAQTRKLVLLK